MATSIESRVPFLDHVLVEFASRIPSRLRTHGLSGKHILKEAVGDLLPKSIVYRRKMGFPTPWRAWLEGPQLDSLESLLLEPRAMGRGLFKAEALQRVFTEHRNRVKDNSDRIWRLFNLELWHRVFLDSEKSTFNPVTRQILVDGIL